MVKIIQIANGRVRRVKRSLGYVIAVLVLVLLAIYPHVGSAEAADEPRFTGLSFELLQLSENQFQVRVSLSATSMPIAFPAGSLSIGWAVSSDMGSVTTGTISMGGTTALNSPNPYPITEVINATGLSSGTSYVVSATAGVPGNMVSGSRTIITNGTNPTATTSPGQTTTTIFYSDEPLYHARIDSDNIVIDVCVCYAAFVIGNPSRYPGTWVPMWMGVNGKNYAGIGWWYDAEAQNFYPQRTTTSTVPSTTTTTPGGGGNTTPAATTQAPSRGGSNPVTTRPRTISTTTAVDAVEDDGQSDDDFADIGVSYRSGKFDMRISSSFPEIEMMLRAFKKGSKSIIWNMTTNADGNYRILTTRALKGFTLSLWIDGDKWDSLTVR